MSVRQGDVRKALLFTAKMTGLSLDDDEVAYYLQKLKGRMNGEEIVMALDDLAEKNRKPTLSAVFGYEKGGFDSTEQAYAKAIANMTDETATCLMNDCIAQAWSVARPLYEEGMKFDASKAFASVYEEKVIEQKSVGATRPKWWLSIGTDKAQRDDFIRQSASDGIISIEYAKTHLPHLTIDEIKNPGLLIDDKGVTGLIEASKSTPVLTDVQKASFKSNIEKLKLNLAGGAA